MYDASLTMGSGLEVVSPILKDKKEDLDDIKIACKLLKDAGQEIGRCCGGHVHIGSDYLKSKEAYANLFEIWGNAERILYIISNEEGSIPRAQISKSVKPISKKLSGAIEKGTINIDSEESLDEFIEQLQAFQNNNELGRVTSLNLLNINNGRNTVEFRVANGTLDSNTWIDNIRLYGRIVQISEKLAQIEKKTEELTEEEIRLMELMQKLKEVRPESEKMEILLELLFEEEERDIYRKRYTENSKLLEEAAKEGQDPLRTYEFAESVDFRKHRKAEYGEIAYKNPKLPDNYYNGLNNDGRDGDDRGENGN